MNAGELIAVLSEVHPETIVVMSRDSEGNGYSPLSEADDSSAYLADTTWSGDIAIRELDDDLRAQGFTEKDVAGEDHVPCVVLWPVN